MKPFLAIDLTNNKKNEQINGSEFLVQETSAALAQRLETSVDQAQQTVKKSKLPLGLRIAQYVCGLGAVMILCGILKSDVDFAQGYANAPELYWVGGIGAVVWLCLWLWGKRKSKKLLGTEESQQTMSHLENTAEAVYRELGVPEGAKDVDVLFFFYKEKDGQIRVTEKGICQYFNPEFKVFADGENLYLVNLEGKYAIPLSAMKRIYTVKKHIRMAGWNKQETFNKGIYKPYKMTTDDYGCVHCKQYSILEFQFQGQTYGLYIPPYELAVFEAVTGLKAETSAEKRGE